MLAYIATKATAKVNFFCQFIPLSRHFYPFSSTLTHERATVTISTTLLTNSTKLLTNSAKLLTILAGSYRKARGHVTYDTKARDLRYVGS